MRTPLYHWLRTDGHADGRMRGRFDAARCELAEERHVGVAIDRVEQDASVRQRGWEQQQHSDGITGSTQARTENVFDDGHDRVNASSKRNLKGVLVSNAQKTQRAHSVREPRRRPRFAGRRARFDSPCADTHLQRARFRLHSLSSRALTVRANEIEVTAVVAQHECQRRFHLLIRGRAAG